MSVASSPMADSVPTLTKTTSSPASRAESDLDVLTPPPEDVPVANGGGKGKRKAPPSAGAVTKKPKTAPKAQDVQENGNGEGEREKKPYCHQCRLAVEPENLLRCTKLRKHSKLQPERACNYVWCERDLVKRYGIDVDAARRAPRAAEGHDNSLPYTFECPCCREQCQNATCRKKKGLEPLGNVVKKAEDSGMTMAEFLRKSDAGEIPETPPKKKKSKSKAKPKEKASKDQEAGDNSDSELSDPDAPPKKAAPKKKKAEAKKATTKASAKTAKAKTAKGKADAKSKAKGKDAKGKATAAAKKKTTTKKVEPKKVAPKKKVLPEPPHPVIKNVDTRLSFEEAEQRMYLREFVVRFRGILSLPDRALAPLDDFDHPIPEATVRSVAGGLLDLIIADRGLSYGTTFDVIDTLEDLREELRHYADLARFAKIFAEVEDLLGLSMAPEPSNESRERNEAALRSLLDLDEGEATPTWATDAPRRGRAAASRIPSAVEVVRMLLGLCEYVIPLDAVRADMEPGGTREMDYRREAARQAKAENQRWEAEKKKLLAARVRCTTAAATKANKATYDAREAEHLTTLHGIELVPRTVAMRKNNRFTPLGLDSQDRKYYFLTPRLIDEERYRPGPSSWARTVYIFGKGFPWDDSLPQAVERWMRVDSAEELKMLGRWIAWELHNKLEAMAREGYWPARGPDVLGLTEEEMEKALALRKEREEQKEQREAAERKEREKEQAEREKEQDAPQENGTRVPPDSQVNGISKADFNEVASSAAGPSSEAGSDASALSSAPSQVEDLLALLDYTPSYDKMEERYCLVAALGEATSFVKQLEVRGF